MWNRGAELRMVGWKGSNRMGTGWTRNEMGRHWRWIGRRRVTVCWNGVNNRRYSVELVVEWVGRVIWWTVVVIQWDWRWRIRRTIHRDIRLRTQN